MLLAALPAFAATNVVVLALSGSAVVEGAPGPVGAPPRRLATTDTLVIGASARAKLLVDGRLVTLTEPGRYTLATIAAPAATGEASASLFDGLDAARRDTKAVGAHRGGGELAPLAPIPGQRTDEVAAVRWPASDRPVAVIIRDVDGEIVTAQQGAGRIVLAEPIRQPGAYTLLLDGQSYAFQIVGPGDRAAIEAITGQVARVDATAQGTERAVLEAVSLCTLGWPGAAASRVARIDDDRAAQYWLEWVQGGCAGPAASP
jgi:hypothetical protein